MNLKDYIKSKGKSNQRPTRNFSDPNEAIAAYGKMSEEDLMQELRSVADERRQNGTLNPAELEAFFSSASPMLTPEQRAKMRTLIDELKR